MKFQVSKNCSIEFSSLEQAEDFLNRNRCWEGFTTEADWKRFEDEITEARRRGEK